jgi:hypothetical protein
VTYVYNVLFHPLRKYPGPKLSSASALPLVYHMIKGDPVYWTMKIHDQYDSDVVRVAPNELSYRDARAWKEIYGHRKAGQPALVKKYVNSAFRYTQSLELQFEDTDVCSALVHTSIRNHLKVSISQGNIELLLTHKLKKEMLQTSLTLTMKRIRECAGSFQTPSLIDLCTSKRYLHLTPHIV